MPSLSGESSIHAAQMPNAGLEVTVDAFLDRDDPHITLGVELFRHISGTFLTQEVALYLTPDQAEFIVGAIGDAYITALHASNHRGTIRKEQVQ